MLRKILVPALAAALVTLLLSSRAHAWGGYHVGYTHVGYESGYHSGAAGGVHGGYGYHYSPSYYGGHYGGAAHYGYPY